MIDEKSVVAASDKSNENQALKALDQVAGVLSKSRRNMNSARADELIGSLSDAYENRRARQVFEWEKARRSRNADL